MNKPTCRIVCGNNEIYSSHQRGIAPLVALVENGTNVKGCVAYDKIVGKAAALLYVLMEIGQVHAEVLSKAAAEIFTLHKIPFTYHTLAEKIINRSGNDICPMEKTVTQIDDPQEAFVALKKKLSPQSSHC